RRADAGNTKTDGANRQKLAHEFSGGSGMARNSRLGPRRAFPGAENFDQLERSPAEAALENPGTPRLVLARSGWPHAFHPGPARPNRNGGVLRRGFGQGNLENGVRWTPERSDGRSWTTRDADAGEWRALRRQQHRNISAAKPGHGRNRLEEAADPGCR